MVELYNLLDPYILSMTTPVEWHVIKTENGYSHYCCESNKYVPVDMNHPLLKKLGKWHARWSVKNRIAAIVEQHQTIEE